MKNTLFLTALVVALGLIGFLYRQVTVPEESLKLEQRRFADCQQVNFQLQMKANGNAPRGNAPAQDQ